MLKLEDLAISFIPLACALTMFKPLISSLQMVPQELWYVLRPLLSLKAMRIS